MRRWQLYPVYAAVAIVVLVLVVVPPSSGWLRFGLLGLAAAAGLAGVLLNIALPVPSPPPLDGPFLVGATTMHLSGSDRPEIHSDDPGDRRELMLQIWYPAADVSGPGVGYLPDAVIGGRALATAFDMPPFLLGHMGLIRANASPNPEPAATDRPFPVVLFSHGRGGTRVQNTYQCEELASHGYVVAAVDHAYGAGYTVYPDGRVIDYDQSIFGDDSPEAAGPVINEWVQDLQWVLDVLEGLNTDNGGRFAGRLDLDRVGGFGHSAGAGAMMELAYRDPRCGSVVAYDPWVVPVSDEAIANGLGVPLLVFKQGEPLGPLNDGRLEGIMDRAPSGSRKLDVEGAKHLDFNDFKRILPAMRLIGMTGSIGAERLRMIMNDETRAFFDTHLRVG